MINQAKLAQALRDIDEATKHATNTELLVAHQRGDLPTGIYAWIRAYRTILFKASENNCLLSSTP